MRYVILFLVALFIGSFSRANSLSTNIPKSFSKIMKKAIEAKDAQAACYLLGNAQGYLRALKESGNTKATKLYSETMEVSGSTCDKANLDSKSNFTPEAWANLSTIQQKVESTEL